MDWSANPFQKPSQMYERMVVSDLKAIEQLPPAAQKAIAEDVSRFINMARLNSPLLDQLFAAAAQDRHLGASSKQDPRRDAASLKEAWCGAKLGKARGSINSSTADAIVQGIEGFAFNPKHHR